VAAFAEMHQHATAKSCRIAAAACCGHTPLPTIRNWSFLEIPIAGSVTQPAGQPINHSENAALNRGLPFLPGSVGAGAGPTMFSQRRMAGSYLPQLEAISRACPLSKGSFMRFPERDVCPLLANPAVGVQSKSMVVRKSMPPSPCRPAPKQSDDRGVGRSRMASVSDVPGWLVPPTMVCRAESAESVTTGVGRSSTSARSPR
jgi:hypothetical protein